MTVHFLSSSLGGGWGAGLGGIGDAHEVGQVDVVVHERHEGRVDVVEPLDRAVRAGQLLLRVGTGRGQVYDLSPAKPALLSALNDSRQQLVMLVGQVLAVVNDKAAQEGLLTAALDPKTSDEVKISLFQSLSASAKMKPPWQVAWPLSITRPVVQKSRSTLSACEASTRIFAVSSCLVTRALAFFMKRASPTPMISSTRRMSALSEDTKPKASRTRMPAE